jgi:hypothetical protein
MNVTLYVTPWFNWDEPPVRQGPYEVRYPGKPNEILQRHWDGKDWLWPWNMLPCGFGDTPATRGEWRGTVPQ